MDNLNRYNFKDDHGHPLENCQDYIDLLKRASSTETELAAMRQRAEEAERELKDTLSRHIDLFNSLKVSWDKKGSRILSAECKEIEQRKRAERAEASAAEEEEKACEKAIQERDELDDILGNIAACFDQEFSSSYGPEDIEHDIRELQENRDIWQSKAEGMEKRVRTAIARAERAEEALRQCRTELADFQRLAHGKTEFPPTKGMELADAVLSGDHIEDNLTMVGDQPTDPYNGELGRINLRLLARKMLWVLRYLKRQGVYHPAMDDLITEGIMHGLEDDGPIQDPAINHSERERRLGELVKEAFLQGFDAKDSEVSAPTTDISYSERAEEAWERSQAHATLAGGGGKKCCTESK